MSAKDPQPIPALIWLIRRISTRDAANAAVGDLLDELADRTRMGRAPRSPFVWLNVQTLLVVLGLLISMTPRLLRTAWHMLRDAERSLRRAPAYSLLVITLLTVGIAAGTITYSVVDAVVLRPLALEQGDRLVTVPTWDEKFKVRISADGFRNIHDRVTGFDRIAKVFIENGGIVTIGGVTDEIDVLSATADVFQVFQFSPTIGRTWTADDEARGETDVAVLSHRYWVEHFRADPAVIGKSVAYGRSGYRVIGVLAAEADIPGLDYLACPLWVPMTPGRDHFAVIGRTRPGIGPTQIANEIQTAIATPDWRPDVVPLLDTYVGKVRGWMLLALGAAGLIVLIACANAANIMLTRSLRRSQELAIRSSLGASRRMIAASVMTEGLLLSVAASACALLLGVWGIQAARVAVTTYLPGTFRAATIALDGRVFAAAIGAALVTGVCASLVPAWQASRVSVLGILKDAAPTVTGGGRSWRSGLLVGEIASVTVLLVLSWLFVTSLVRVVGIDLGIDRSHLLAVSPRLDFKGTVDDVRGRLESINGVTGIAVVGGSLPLVGRAFGGAWDDASIRRAETAGDAPVAKVLRYRVTPNYFDVAGIHFRSGSGWSAQGGFETSPVVLEERAAAQLFGGEDPLGRQISVADPAGVFTVIGIVPRVYARGPEFAELPAAYFPLRPSASRTWATLLVRTSPPPEDMVPIVTEALAPLAPEGKRPYIHAVNEAEQKLTATRRFNAGLMGSFGCIAMLIGAAGIYGVITAIVAQQTREIGVRVALGATPGEISRRVLRLTAVHVSFGLGVGLPLAWWISRGFASYLFEVTPADPSVYVGVAVLVGMVGLVAAFIPARRAARTDPLITLRS